MALGRPRPGGRRCIPPSWRALGSSAGKPARAAFTMPRSTSGASCTGATSPSPGKTWFWTSSRTSRTRSSRARSRGASGATRPTCGKWTPEGTLYEADPHQAEQLLRDLLKSACADARGVSFSGL
eukprot:10612808-Alexandrium_andersonii.AAC.1